MCGPGRALEAMIGSPRAQVRRERTSVGEPCTIAQERRLGDHPANLGAAPDASGLEVHRARGIDRLRPAANHVLEPADRAPPVAVAHEHRIERDSVELGELAHPRPGGSIGLWAFVGVTPFVRVGIVEKLGGFAEVGLHISLPVLRR